MNPKVCKWISPKFEFCSTLTISCTGCPLHSPLLKQCQPCRILWQGMLRFELIWHNHLNIRTTSGCLRTTKETGRLWKAERAQSHWSPVALPRKGKGWWLGSMWQQVVLFWPFLNVMLIERKEWEGWESRSWLGWLFLTSTSAKRLSCGRKVSCKIFSSNLDWSWKWLAVENCSPCKKCNFVELMFFLHLKDMF